MYIPGISYAMFLLRNKNLDEAYNTILFFYKSTQMASFRNILTYLCKAYFCLKAET